MVMGLQNFVTDLKKSGKTNITKVLRDCDQKSLYINPTQHRTTKYEKSTLWRASKAWNAMNPELRLIDETTKFKVEIQRAVTRAYHKP